MSNQSHKGIAASGLVRMIALPLLALPIVVLPGCKTESLVQPEPQPFENFNAADFDACSAVVNNPWLPLVPGTKYVYEGITVVLGVDVVHRLELHVTDLTKVVGGVKTIASWDLDFNAGLLVEHELAFYAQDRNGNVWQVGEYPEELDNGTVLAVPTWMQGIADAVAGIAMRANPVVDGSTYSQGWGPLVNFTDRGRVDQVGQQTCVPMDCYDNVLVIAEKSAIEIGEQLKYFAPGVGNVRVGWRGEGELTRERLELVSIEQLSVDDLAAARAQAFLLEARAYARSLDVYALTPPMEALQACP